MIGGSAPVLVTGAMGAIGSWVTRRLVEEGHPLVAFDARADYTLLRDLEGRIPFVQGDLLDRDGLAATVRASGARCIVHLAALMPPACEADPALGYRVNLLGALNVFDVARELGVGRVVFASSKSRYGAMDGEYGAPTFRPVTEEYVGTPPLDVYGSTKLALEDAARHYRRLWNMDLIALRFGSTYGPGKLQRHGALSLKSRIVEMGALGEPFAVPTPEAIDDVVYNRDLAKAVLLACSAPRPEHWQFNISGGQLVTIREFTIETMRCCPEHRLSLDESSRDTRPPGTPATNGLLSNARARAELGYEPDFPGVAGVADYVDWVRRNQAVESGVTGR